MPRRRVVAKREIPPDGRYNNTQVQKFINVLMWKGEKSIAEKIFYGAMGAIEERTGEDPLKIFLKAIENVKPVLEVKSRRVGGSTYQVPVEVRPGRRLSLAFRWVIGFARKRTGKDMARRLADEILDAYNNTGASIKKKEDTHRMAEANRAFAHYRW